MNKHQKLIYIYIYMHHMFKIEHLSLHHLHNWGSQTLCRWVFLGKKLHQRRPGMTMDGSKFYEDSFLGAWETTCLMASKDSGCFLCVSLLLEGFEACSVNCIHGFFHQHAKKESERRGHFLFQNLLRSDVFFLTSITPEFSQNCSWLSNLVPLGMHFQLWLGWTCLPGGQMSQIFWLKTNQGPWTPVARPNKHLKLLPNFSKPRKCWKKNINFKQSPDPLH